MRGDPPPPMVYGNSNTSLGRGFVIKGQCWLVHAPCCMLGMLEGWRALGSSISGVRQEKTVAQGQGARGRVCAMEMIVAHLALSPTWHQPEQYLTPSNMLLASL